MKLGAELESRAQESSLNTVRDALAPARSADVTEAVSDAICRVLREGIDVHRCLAARALGRIGRAEDVDTLVAALLDEDEDVRTDAAAALARSAPRAAGEQLLENLLGDPCSSVKLNAIDALVAMRHPEVASWLRRLVRGRDEDMAWDEGDFYEQGWDDWLDVQVEAIQGLADLGVEGAVPEIVAALDDEAGQDLTEIGFKALARLGEPGAEALAAYLDDPEPRRRRRVATALGASKSDTATAAIARALKDSQRDVRLAALRALASRDPADARLSPLLDDKDTELRAEAVRLCGFHHPDRLSRLLDGDSPAVTAAVLQLLANMPDLLPCDRVVDAALARLHGADENLSAEAAMVLAAAAPERARDELIAQAGNADRPLGARLGAIRALSRLDDEPASQALADVIGDETRQVRLEAMAALARMAAAAPQWPSLPGRILLAALRGELVPEPAEEVEPDTTADAEPVPEPQSDAGPDEGDEAAFPKSTLQAILGEEASTVIPSEGRGIELTPADMERLARAEKGPRRRVVTVLPPVAPHKDVPRFAARVLGDVGNAEVALALAEVLSAADGEVRQAAADSLARVAEAIDVFPDAVTEALVRTLGDSDRAVRLSVTRALGAAGGPDVSRDLAVGLGDEDSFIRAEAVRALGRLGRVGTDAVKLLGDPDPGVRLAAAEAIAAAGTGNSIDAVEALTEFAFAFEGYHRGAVGRLLRTLDAAAASKRLLDVFDDTGRLRFWPVALETLEEIHCSDAAAVESPPTRPIQQEGVGLS